MMWKLMVGGGIYALLLGAEFLVVDRVELKHDRPKPLVPVRERDLPEQPIIVEPWVPWSCFGGGASALLIAIPRLTKKE